MKKALFVLVFALLASLSFAQTNTFSLSLSPISLPGGKQTVAGTEAGATLTVTNNLDLGNVDILAPGSNFQYFAGKFNYRLPVLQTKLNNASPNLDGFRFGFYVTGSAGIDRITGPVTAQHYGFTAGMGLNYDLTGKGTWTFGGEVQYAKFPGLANNTYLISVGPAIHF